ncbi:MAG TPA: cation:proton antiporter [Candidatus Saccharimonadales bacterium]|nr:cation:proton antiporter [Candidatus Saccharimonadales bacterium]
MNEVFSGLSIIIVIGALVSLLMRSIRQPLMIGYIVTGIIVGPALLHISKSPDTLTVFGDIGIALLLFIIGLGMNPKIVREVGRPSVITALTHMSITGILGWLLLVALGLHHQAATFIAIGLTINSTIVALKLLGDKKEQGRLYGKLTVGVSLVEDIIAAILLLFLASAHNGHWLSIGPLIGLIFKACLVGLAMYLLSKELLPRFHRLIAGDQELLFLTAIAIGLGSSALLAKIGLSMEIGALAAGIMLATQPYAQEVAARLRPLRDFFVIVFFIALGTELTFTNFSHLLLPIIAGTLLVVLVKPFIIIMCLGYLGYTKRTSFMASIALSQVSEFSIIFLVLADQKGLVSHQHVSLLTFIALASIAISTYMVTFSEKIYKIIENSLDIFERKKAEGEVLPKEQNELVLFGYQRGGHEFVNLFKKMNKKYVVIDYDPDVIDTVEQRKLNYLYGDATDVELLEEAGVDSAKLIVSTIPDYQTNKVLVDYIKHKNHEAIIIIHADDPYEAAKLYEAGASYVILPHYLGSEKLSEFISKSGLAKSAFRKQRIRHLDYLEKHYGALEKLNAINEKKLGRSIVSRVAKLSHAKAKA